MPATHKPHVLVVDDEPGVRESLRLILKDRAEVALAASGEEALACRQILHEITADISRKSVGRTHTGAECEHDPASRW